MKGEIIEIVKSLSSSLNQGVLVTTNGTEHHVLKRLNRIEDLVNKNFDLANVSGSVCVHPFEFVVIKGTDICCFKCGYKLK